MLRGVTKLGRGAGGSREKAAVRMFARNTRLERFRGFTLLELMIVISIIMILMAVAVPMYNQSIVQARESVLRSNLGTLRSLISQYTLDKQKAPQSLDDLVTAGYLRQVPMGPMTPPANWEGVQEGGMVPAGQRRHRLRHLVKPCIRLLPSGRCGTSPTKAKLIACPFRLARVSLLPRAEA